MTETHHKLCVFSVLETKPRFKAGSNGMHFNGLIDKGCTYIRSRCLQGKAFIDLSHLHPTRLVVTGYKDGNTRCACNVGGICLDLPTGCNDPSRHESPQPRWNGWTSASSAGQTISCIQCLAGIEANPRQEFLSPGWIG
eukprot:scaffold297_cov171-Amphora_coffeaeformis.AAC.3